RPEAPSMASAANASSPSTPAATMITTARRAGRRRTTLTMLNLPGPATVPRPRCVAPMPSRSDDADVGSHVVVTRDETILHSRQSRQPALFLLRVGDPESGQLVAIWLRRLFRHAQDAGNRTDRVGVRGQVAVEQSDRVETAGCRHVARGAGDLRAGRD